MKGYTDKATIENYLLIEIDVAFDDQITEWIEAAELYIDKATNRDFTPGDAGDAYSDRRFTGDGSDTMPIDATIDIEEIRFSETGDPISETNYFLLPERSDTTTKIKLQYMKFPKGYQNIYVSAKWGYAEVPKDIKLAATVLAAGIINNAWNSEGEVASMTVGRYSVTYKTKKQMDDFASIDDILLLNKRYTF